MITTYLVGAKREVSIHLCTAHLQIPNFIRHVFLGHAVIQTSLLHRFLWNEDAVV